MRLLVRFRMIRCADDNAVARRQPRYLADLPFGVGKSFCFARSQSEQPQPRMLVLFVDEVFPFQSRYRRRFEGRSLTWGLVAAE